MNFGVLNCFNWKVAVGDKGEIVTGKGDGYVKERKTAKKKSQ